MILILGPPGSGKGVQAKLLEEQGRVQWFSMGKILREHISGEVEEIMKNGKLVDDQVTFEALGNAMDKATSEPVILLDGFPRRISQLTWLVEYLDKHNRSLTKIIHLNVPETEVLMRLRKRGRLDDDDDTIHARYVQYLEGVMPVIATFTKKNVPIHEIDGVDSVENIHKQIVSDF